MEDQDEFCPVTFNTKSFDQKISRNRNIGLDFRGKAVEYKEAEKAKFIPWVKEIKDVMGISNSLGKHFIFSTLPCSLRAKIIREMELFHFDANEIVFSQGTIGQNFYLIVKGEVAVMVDWEQVDKLKKSDAFGELALIHDFPRTASIVTLMSTYLWVLKRDAFKKAVHGANRVSIEENTKFIKVFPLFSTLNHDQINCLAENMVEYSYRPNKKIISEGEPGEFIFFIKSGTVKIRKNGRNVSEILAGGYFGEESLNTDNFHLVSIVSITEVKCGAISRKLIEKSLGLKLQKIISDNLKLKAIGKSSLLNRLDQTQQNKLLDSFFSFKFNSGEIVIPAGSLIGEKMWIVLAGKIGNNENFTNTFKCIGDTEIVNDSVKVLEKNICALESAEVGVLSKDDILQCFGNNNTNLSIDDVNALRKVGILRELPQSKFSEVVKCLKIQKFSDGETIVLQGTPGEFFFVIQSGKVEIVQDGMVLRSISKYDYFGERSLLFDEMRTATVAAKGEVNCWTLKSSDFLRTLHGNLRKKLIDRISMQDDSVTLTELKYIKVLGKGAFGTVFLVVDTRTTHLFALKVITQKIIQKYKLELYIQLEQRILSAVNHDFILKLVKTFENDKGIYLLTEYVKGQDLFDLHQKNPTFTENDCQFYIACLILIIEYLHERDIIYRDLKPENIMIEEDGHPKLIDFGSSKFIQERTYTVLGTPFYMAPEIIQGSGYSFPVDYWSLGVILYELIYRKVPFGDGESDPFRIYESILKRSFNFPSYTTVSAKFVNFMNQLFSMNPILRNSGNNENLKANPWLKDVNWEKIISREVSPPLIPDLKDITHENSIILSDFPHFESIFDDNFIK